MESLSLPPLVGSRVRAKALAAQLPENLAGATVTVDGRNMVAATVSFVDELLKQILVERHGDRLRIVNVDDLEFVDWVREQARANDVFDRVCVEPHAAVSAS